MEYVLNCHKPLLNKYKNIYSRTACHPYVDFCQSLFKAWTNIKKHYHNDFNSDRNSLHVKFTKKFDNVILSIAAFLSAADGKLDLIWLQSGLRRKIKIHVEIDFLQVLIWKNLKLSNLLTAAFFLCLYLCILCWIYWMNPKLVIS